ncbi:MAG: peptidylprolyl isomerase, partial [Patescibacteria group bacterium]
MRFLSWKVAAIILVALVLGYVDLPDTYQSLPFTPQSVKDRGIHLGLDLQGGSQLDYKIDLRKVPVEDRETIVEGVKEVINKRVNSLGVSEPNIYLSQVGEEQHIIVELAGVKDLEKAKTIVGKTIPLEFKEQKTELDPGEKTAIKNRAQALFNRVRGGKEDFAVLGLEEQNANPGKSFFQTVEFTARDGVQPADAADALFSSSAGTVLPKLFETENGLFMVKLLEKRDFEREDDIAATVNARHILVAYKDAQRADAGITRTRREAKKLVSEVLDKAKAGEVAFEALAKEYSDEPGADESGGKLSAPVTDDGSYVEAFTNAALKLEKAGDISNIVETEFGFHIIKADAVTPAEKKKTIEPQIKYSYLFVSTAPDQWKETALGGQHFVRADVQFDQLYQPQISISFNDEGAKLFEKITGDNVGKPVAIFVDGVLKSSPSVREKITGGQAVISGQFTPDEAQALARDLNTGAIPAPVVLTGQYTIGATLGQEALSNSLKAGLVGIILVALFMTLYYRLPGLIATVALAIYSAILIFLLKAGLPLAVSLSIGVILFIVLMVKVLRSQEHGWEKLISGLLSIIILFFVTFLLSNPIVLTLAGVAGVILSIGMAVDANILIFERLKEELRLGRPVRDAVEIGFDRAWSSIRDSNFSSLITCGILFFFGTSIIQGFAFNLAAGILISMFTAITVTRAFLLLLIQSPLGKKQWLWGAQRIEGGERPPLHIMERKKIWFSFSGILILISLVSFA